MHIRVKIEYAGNAKGRYGYATTEHSASSYGQPVIQIGTEACGPADIATAGGTIVTSDKELAAQMDSLGYPVRISNPQKAYAAANSKTIAASVNNDTYAEFMRLCKERGLTVHAAIKRYIDAVISGRDLI